MTAEANALKGSDPAVMIFKKFYLLFHRFQQLLGLTLSVIVRVIAPLIANLAEYADNIFSLVCVCNLNERIPKCLAEILILHYIRGFAVCDHIVINLVRNADYARLIHHFIGAAEGFLPFWSIFGADVSVGNHNIFLSGSKTCKRSGVGIRLHSICKIADAFSIFLIQP